LVVSATYNLFRCNLFRVSRTSARSSARNSTGSELYVNRELTWGQCRGVNAGGIGSALFGPQLVFSKVQLRVDQKLTPPARLRPSYCF
jgi:hypothetical protein